MEFFESEKLEKDLEIKERLEHRNVILALQAILNSPSGRVLFSYLFKHFEVAQPVEFGIEGAHLHERLGFLRAGNSVFKLASEADHAVAAEILTKIEKDRYDELIKASLDEAGR